MSKFLVGVVAVVVECPVVAAKPREHASKTPIGIPVSNLTWRWMSRSRSWRWKRLWRKPILISHLVCHAMKRETNGVSRSMLKARAKRGVGMWRITKRCPTQRSQKCTVTFLTAAAEASPGDNCNIRKLLMCLCYLCLLLACLQLFHNVQCQFYLILVAKANYILPLQI